MRIKNLESVGLMFLRFTNHDVVENFQDVVKKIEEWIKDYLKTLSLKGTTI